METVQDRAGGQGARGMALVGMGVIRDHGAGSDVDSALGDVVRVKVAAEWPGAT